MNTKKNPFNNAFRGFKWFAQSQWNFKIHILATILAFASALILKISLIEWVVIILSIALVWVSELLNTAIEFTLDKLHPAHDKLIGKAKDVAAAAVLMASFTALIVGALIFIPRILSTIT